MKIVLSSLKLEVFFFLSLINVKIDSSQLYCNVECYSQWLNIGGGGNFIEKSVLVSVILAFSHKKKRCH